VCTHHFSNHSKEEQMLQQNRLHTPERLTIVRWVARLGAVTAEALALHEGRTLASARAHLLAAERAGLLCRRRVLADAPVLYTVTRVGLRASGLRGLEPCRISVSNAPHAIACAEVAAAIEHAYPDHQVMGERELRREEREAGMPLASASLGNTAADAPLLHRPDLVLWPNDPQECLPVAVEVELTIKAPRRLLEICRAWARCRCIAGTLYLATPEVLRALTRAIDGVQGNERIVVVALDALLGGNQPSCTSSASTVPTDA
jgi:DNA-binding transcriptional ArsR family regulator